MLRDAVSNFRGGLQRIDDIEINYVAAGKRLPLLLLHSLPQVSRYGHGWRRRLRAISRWSAPICASSKLKCAADRPNYAVRAMASDQVGLMKLSRAADRGRSGLLLRDLPGWLGRYQACRFRCHLVAEYPALLARSGHDPLLLLGLSRRCQRRSGARRRRYR